MTSTSETQPRTQRRGPFTISASVLMWVRGIASLLIIGAGVMVFMWLGQAKRPAKRPAAGNVIPEVELVSVTRHEGFDVEADGEVVAFRSVDRSTEVAGTVLTKETICETGSYVKKNTKLCVIDPADYDLETKRLKKQREQADANIRELDLDIANNEKMRGLAEEELRINREEEKRWLSNPAIAKTEKDQATRRRIISENALAALENKIALARVRREGLVTAKELVGIQLEQAKLNKTRTIIRAPFDGVITAEHIEEGGFLQKGTRLFSIAQTSRVEVICNLQMEDLYWVWAQRKHNDSERHGQLFDIPPTKTSIRYRLANRTDLVFEWEGMLTAYDGVGINPNTRTVPCRVIVENPQSVKVYKNGVEIKGSVDNGPRQLFPGMFVQATLHTKPLNRLIRIPVKAIRQPNNLVWKYVTKTTTPTPGDSGRVTNTSVTEPGDGSTNNRSTNNRSTGDGSTGNGSTGEEDWQQGKIVAIKNLQTLRKITGKTKSGKTINDWLIDGTDVDLQEGDHVVISQMSAPTENAKVRVRKAAKTKETR